MAFVPKTLDYTVSPYTGLTRQSWIEAGTYLLEGVKLQQYERTPQTFMADVFSCRISTKKKG